MAWYNSPSVGIHLEPNLGLTTRSSQAHAGLSPPGVLIQGGPCAWGVS